MLRAWVTIYCILDRNLAELGFEQTVSASFTFYKGDVT
jgi:hypothetical protein